MMNGDLSPVDMSCGGNILDSTRSHSSSDVCHQCSSCSFTSEESKIFNRHLKRDHKVKEKDSDDEDDERQSLFMCNMGCSFESDRFNDYRSHYICHIRFCTEPRDLVMRYFQCNQCPYVSSEMMLTDAHMDDAHPNNNSNFLIQREKFTINIPKLPVSVSGPIGKVQQPPPTNSHNMAPTAPPPLIRDRNQINGNSEMRPPPPMYPHDRNSQLMEAYRSPLDHMHNMQRERFTNPHKQQQQHHQQQQQQQLIRASHHSMQPIMSEHYQPIQMQGQIHMHNIPNPRHAYNPTQALIQSNTLQGHLQGQIQAYTNRTDMMTNQLTQHKNSMSTLVNQLNFPIPVPVTQQLHPDSSEPEVLESLGHIEMPYIKKELMDDDESADGSIIRYIESPLRSLAELDPEPDNGKMNKTTCLHCGDSFSSLGNMKRHVRRRHGTNRYSPHLQPQQQLTLSASGFTPLTPRQRKRHGSSIICKECPFQCRTQSLLEKHMMNHAKMIRIADGFKCKYCTSRTRYPVYMRRHLNTYHRDEPAFAHTVSNNRISETLRDMSDQQKNTMDSYISDYINQLPKDENFETSLQCCSCEFVTGKRSDILAHITEHHMTKAKFVSNDGKTLSFNEDGMFRCLYCARTTDDFDDMKKHVYMIHCRPIETAFNCTCCKFQSDEENHLLQHIRESEECSFEQNIIFSERIMQKVEGDGTVGVFTELGTLIENIDALDVFNEESNSLRVVNQSVSIEDIEQQILQFSCVFCDYNNKTTFGIRQHCQNKHPEYKKDITLHRKSNEPREFCSNNIQACMLIDENNYYICKVCNKSLSEQDAYTHASTDHLITECQSCDFCYQNIALLGNVSFNCDKCTKIFKDFNEFKEHRQTHFTNDSIIEAQFVRCIVCNYQNTRFKVRCHAARKHKIKQMPKFRDTIEIKKILCLKMANKYFNTILPNLMMCGFCQYATTADIRMNNKKHLEHLKFKHDAVICGSCVQCKKQFRCNTSKQANNDTSEYTTLEDAMMNPVVPAPIEDALSKANLKSMESFKRVFNDDDEDILYDSVEEIVPKKIRKSQSDSLIKNDGKSSGKYSCNMCDYFSPRLVTIQSHCRKHFNYFPYGCAFCDFKSGFHSVIARHHNINHNSDLPVVHSNEDEKEVLVKTCYSELGVKVEVENVKMEDSGDEKLVVPEIKSESEESGVSLTNRFHCKKCNYTCLSNDRIRLHIQTHFKYRPNHCPLCPFTSTIRANFNIHSKRKHPSHRNMQPIVKIDQSIEDAISANIGTSIKMKVKLSPKKVSDSDGSSSSSKSPTKSNKALPTNEFVKNGYNMLTRRYECDDCRFHCSELDEYTEHMSEHPRDTGENVVGNIENTENTESLKKNIDDTLNDENDTSKETTNDTTVVENGTESGNTRDSNKKYYKCGTCENFHSERRRFIRIHHVKEHPDIPFTSESLLFSFTNPESLKIDESENMDQTKQDVNIDIKTLDGCENVNDLEETNVKVNDLEETTAIVNDLEESNDKDYNTDIVMENIDINVKPDNCEKEENTGSDTLPEIKLKDIKLILKIEKIDTDEIESSILGGGDIIDDDDDDEEEEESEDDVNMNAIADIDINLGSFQSKEDVEELTDNNDRTSENEEKMDVEECTTDKEMNGNVLKLSENESVKESELKETNSLFDGIKSSTLVVL